MIFDANAAIYLYLMVKIDVDVEASSWHARHDPHPMLLSRVLRQSACMCPRMSMPHPLLYPHAMQSRSIWRLDWCMQVYSIYISIYINMQCQFVLLNNDSDRFCRRCRCSWLVLAGNNNSPSIVSWQELIWRDEANTLKFEHWVSMSNEIQWNSMFKTFWTDATGTFTQRISATSMVWRRAFQIWRIYALSASMLEERKNYQTSLCIESTLPLCNRSQHQSESLSSSQLLLYVAISSAAETLVIRCQDWEKISAG